jgi:transposase
MKARQPPAPSPTRAVDGRLPAPADYVPDAGRPPTRGAAQSTESACLPLSGLRTKWVPIWKGREELAGKYTKCKPEFRDEVAKLVIESNRSIAEVAREYGLNETTVGGWVKKYRAVHAVDEPALELSERARLRELERRCRELEIENSFIKKASAYFAREQR